MKVLILFVLINSINFAQKVNASLISEYDIIYPGQKFYIALKLEMNEGWHTYWRNPGDSGLQTDIDLILPEGFSRSEIFWQYPHIFKIGEIVNFGYEKSVLLLIKINSPQKLENKNILIKGKATWLACKEECIPESENLQIQIKVDEKQKIKNSKWFDDIQKTIELIPLKSDLYTYNSKLLDNGILFELIGNEKEIKELNKLHFFPYEQMIFSNQENQNFTKSKNKLSLEIKFDEFATEKPKRLKGVITIESKNSEEVKAIEIDLPINN